MAAHQGAGAGSPQPRQEPRAAQNLQRHAQAESCDQVGEGGRENEKDGRTYSKHGSVPIKKSMLLWVCRCQCRCHCRPLSFFKKPPRGWLVPFRPPLPSPASGGVRRVHKLAVGARVARPAEERRGRHARRAWTRGGAAGGRRQKPNRHVYFLGSQSCSGSVGRDVAGRPTCVCVHKKHFFFFAGEGGRGVRGGPPSSPSGSVVCCRLL